MTSSPKTTANSILGLALDGSRLELVSVKRANGSLEVRQSVSVLLKLDPLTNEPELVGAEIRAHLEAAGVRDRRCVMGVPLNWALTLSVPVPAGLADEDLQSLLQMEAERGFPYPPEALMLSHSLMGDPKGDRTALLVAVPRDHVVRLQRALESIGLRPMSLSLGIAALQPVAESPSADGCVALLPGEKGIALQVTAAGGVAALRLLEGAWEQEGAERRVKPESLGRELRITMGQLPEAVRARVRQLRVFGVDRLAEETHEQISRRAEALGLRPQWVKEFGPLELGVALPAGTAASPALALAARHLTGRGIGFEFLPPHVSRWKQFAAQQSSKKLFYALALLALAVLVVGGVFGWQQWQVAQLESQWNAMKTRVGQIDDLQVRIRKFRPWYDESFRALSILKRLTEAFPEDGTVAAKSVEINARSGVTCSGIARSNSAWLKMLDQLRGVKEISAVKVEHIKGGANGQPLEFTFHFNWGDPTSLNR